VATFSSGSAAGQKKKTYGSSMTFPFYISILRVMGEKELRVAMRFLIPQLPSMLIDGSYYWHSDLFLHGKINEKLCEG
jgi:hypothetical protein